MTEELLYLSMLVSRVNNQYELSLARSLVVDKYPQMTMQDVQECFEQLAVCIRNDVSLPLPSENPFSLFATQLKMEQ